MLPTVKTSLYLPASLKYSSIEKFKANDGKEVVNNHQEDADGQHFGSQVDNIGHDVSIFTFQS